MDAIECNAVKIAVRERNFRDEYKKKSESAIFYPLPNGNTLIVNERPYTLDYVFRPNVAQKEIYDILVKPLVEKALNGFNCTALAYGQTGTGKSYTMGLNLDNFEDENAGVIPRCLQDLFGKTQINDENLVNSSYEISASFVEIYNEKLYDLLIENVTEPILAKGCKFAGSSKMPLKNIAECYELVRNATKNRHVRPTKMNSQSSRSHAIFTIHLQMQRNFQTISSCINFVDLAGSEGVKRTGHQGLAMSEGVFINQGLLSIGKVVQAMTTGSKVIPFRDSVLSTVLQDSLNVNSFITLLACISPHREDLSETLSTLRFAQSAKQLKPNPQINNVLAEIKKKNSLAKINPLAKSNLQSTPFKRPFSQMKMKKQSMPSIPKEGKLSNTFSTPSKVKRLTEYNRCNQSDLGLTPKEKLKAISSRIPTSNIPDFLTNRESSFESIVGSNISLNSTPSIMCEPESTKQISFSPVVRKCLAEFEPRFEAKLMEMMTTLISKTTQTRMPSNQIKPNTPCSELDDSPIISSNIPKTPKNKCNHFATSSPVHDDHNSGDPLEKQITSSTEKGKNYEKRKNVVTRRSATISKCFHDPDSTVPDLFSKPNVYQGNPNKNVRRSLRILERSINNQNSSAICSFNNESSGRKRRSRGLSIKKLNDDKRRYKRLSAHLEISEKPETLKPKTTKENIPLNNSIIEGYIGNAKTNPLDKSDKAKNLANHRKAIMNLLNSGSMKQLTILPQIGQKTAFQIVSYRTLNGKFKKFKQIEKLPIWRGSSWERFAKANMLE